MSAPGSSIRLDVLLPLGVIGGLCAGEAWAWTVGWSSAGVYRFFVPAGVVGVVSGVLLAWVGSRYPEAVRGGVKGAVLFAAGGVVMAFFLALDDFERGVRTAWAAAISTSLAAGWGLAAGCGITVPQGRRPVEVAVVTVVALCASAFFCWSSHLGRFFFFSAFWASGVAVTATQLLMYGPPPPQVEEAENLG